MFTNFHFFVIRDGRSAFLDGVFCENTISGFKTHLTCTLAPVKIVVFFSMSLELGFGNACARRLNADGYTVVAGCLDDQSEGAQCLQEIATGHLSVIKLDITDAQSVQSCATKLQTLCGGHGKPCYDILYKFTLNFFDSLSYEATKCRCAQSIDLLLGRKWLLRCIELVQSFFMHLDNPKS